ncbi:uncharacterized protein PAC_18843 [Phialocephala subalpina]|uniref:Uncharacterized protein n=1 Tax=Phialocephala subalpina TaxID=576137 RepID=A0A1L7XV63_9HELO|nr:uncharacterized protein PAC_18843 [Phialocephala subalpina]
MNIASWLTAKCPLKDRFSSAFMNSTLHVFKAQQLKVFGQGYSFDCCYDLWPRYPSLQHSFFLQASPDRHLRLVREHNSREGWITQLRCPSRCLHRALNRAVALIQKANRLIHNSPTPKSRLLFGEWGGSQSSISIFPSSLDGDRGLSNSVLIEADMALTVVAVEEHRRTYENGDLLSERDKGPRAIDIAIHYIAGVKLANIITDEHNADRNDDPAPRSPVWKVLTAATMLRDPEVQKDLKILWVDNTPKIIKKYKENAQKGKYGPMIHDLYPLKSVNDNCVNVNSKNVHIVCRLETAKRSQKPRLVQGCYRQVDLDDKPLLNSDCIYKVSLVMSSNAMFRS